MARAVNTANRVGCLMDHSEDGSLEASEELVRSTIES